MKKSKIIAAVIAIFQTSALPAWSADSIQIVNNQPTAVIAPNQVAVQQSHTAETNLDPFEAGALSAPASMEIPEGFQAARSNSGYAYKIEFTDIQNPMQSREILKIIELATGAEKEVYNKPAAEEDIWDKPDVSSDGKHLVLTTRSVGGTFKVYVKDLTTSAQAVEMTVSQDESVSKAPNAIHISDKEIRFEMVSADMAVTKGTYIIDRTTLTGKFEPANTLPAGYVPAKSNADFAFKAEYGGETGKLYLLNVKTGNSVELITTYAIGQFPAYLSSVYDVSPDGKAVIYGYSQTLYGGATYIQSIENPANKIEIARNGDPMPGNGGFDPKEIAFENGIAKITLSNGTVKHFHSQTFQVLAPGNILKGQCTKAETHVGVSSTSCGGIAAGFDGGLNELHTYVQADGSAGALIYDLIKNTVVSSADEINKVTVTVNSGTQPQQISYELNVGPNYVSYSPSYSSVPVSLKSGQKATLTAVLKSQAGGQIDPLTTLPKLVMINGSFVSLEVKRAGATPLGWPVYQISFTVPQLRGDGKDWIKFLSQYDDKNLLEKSYLIDVKGMMREVPEGLSLPAIQQPIAASHGSAVVKGLGNGNYSISDNGVILTPANEKESVVVTVNSSYQPQKVTNAIDVGPQHWTYYPSYSSQTVKLTSGAKVTLSDVLNSRAGGNLEPMSTLPQFAMINGQFIALEVKRVGTNPLGIAQYDVTFTVPQLKGDGTDQIKFISKYDDRTLLVKGYVIDEGGNMQPMPAGLPFGWGMTSNPAYAYQIIDAKDQSSILKIKNLKTGQIVTMDTLRPGEGAFQAPVSVSADGKVIVYGIAGSAGNQIVIQKTDGSGTGRTLNGTLAGPVVFQASQAVIKMIAPQETQPKSVTIAYSTFLTVKQQTIYADFQALLSRDPTKTELAYWNGLNLNLSQMFAQIAVVQERLNKITAILRSSLGYAPNPMLVKQIAASGKSYLQITNEYH